MEATNKKKKAQPVIGKDAEALHRENIRLQKALQELHLEMEKIKEGQRQFTGGGRWATMCQSQRINLPKEIDNAKAVHKYLAETSPVAANVFIRFFLADLVEEYIANQANYEIGNLLDKFVKQRSSPWNLFKMGA